MASKSQRANVTNGLSPVQSLILCLSYYSLTPHMPVSKLLTIAIAYSQNKVGTLCNSAMFLHTLLNLVSVVATDLFGYSVLAHTSLFLLSFVMTCVCA